MVKVKFLDTSALVKLFLDEEGSDRIKDYYRTSVGFCCAEMVFYETMSVLKSRLFKNNNKNRYFESIKELKIMGWGGRGTGKLEIEKIHISDHYVFKEVYDTAMKYDIDLADAIQIYAILKGRYSSLGPESKTVFITADAGLEEAALDNKIRVWNCGKYDKPDWLDN